MEDCSKWVDHLTWCICINMERVGFRRSPQAADQCSWWPDWETSPNSSCTYDEAVPTNETGHREEDLELILSMPLFEDSSNTGPNAVHYSLSILVNWKCDCCVWWNLLECYGWVSTDRWMCSEHYLLFRNEQRFRWSHVYQVHWALGQSLGPRAVTWPSGSYLALGQSLTSLPWLNFCFAREFECRPNVNLARIFQFAYWPVSCAHVSSWCVICGLVRNLIPMWLS